jgi:broad specificity phosphatase PhoE
VTPQELPLLDDRRAARAAYRQLGIHARDWSTPLPVRMELATWDFVQARDLIRESEELLRLRDRVDRLSNAVGAEPSARLERAYETADDAADLTDAKLLAGDQLLSLGEISQAAELLARDRDPLTNLGLLSEAPGEAIGEARTRFEADDQVGARASARRAVQLLNDAPARGRERAVVVGGGLAIAFVLAVILGIRLGRRRRGAVATIGGTLPRQGEPPTS